MGECKVCGNPIDPSKRNYKLAVYCSARCGRRARDAKRRGRGLPLPVRGGPDPEAALCRGSKPKWPVFGIVAGELTHTQFKAATVSDRDPETGRSSFEEFEKRDEEALARMGLIDPRGY
jgi:hypothetical protein